MIDEFTPNEILDIELAGVLAGPRLMDLIHLQANRKDEHEEAYARGFEDGESEGPTADDEREKITEQLEPFVVKLTDTLDQLGDLKDAPAMRGLVEAVRELDVFFENLAS